MALPFTELVDLAAERLGGKALAASDEFFAPKENLLKPGRGVFKPDVYTENGKWMDGWETRRKRTPGHDWCIIQLGLPGVLKGTIIDTNHFLGNHPPEASLEACHWTAGEGQGAVPPGDTEWVQILSRSALEPGSENLFAIKDSGRYNHVRLNIYPDGGVARLRLLGMAQPDWTTTDLIQPLDLAAVENGGLAVGCSNMFFSPMQNLIMPGPGLNMGDGWETRRRRGPGHDWIILRLGRPGILQRVVIDTAYFKGNFPDECSLEGCYLPDLPVDASPDDDSHWTEILPRTKMSADHEHKFADELLATGPFTHLRLKLFPDGGVSRFRAFGMLEQER